MFPFIQGTIAYWLVGLQNDAGKYLFWSLTVILLNNVGTDPPPPPTFRTKWTRRVPPSELIGPAA